MGRRMTLKQADLEFMLVERAIEREVVRFARAMDERDWDTIRKIMLPDATARLADQDLKGPEEVVGKIRSFLDRCGPTQHLVGNVLVAIGSDGASATSRAYINDRHVGTGERSGLIYATLGEYFDKWEKHDGAWRMRHRTKDNRARTGTLEVFGLPS